MSDYYDRKLEKRAPCYKACFWSFIGIVIGVIIAACLSSCGSTKYIEVPVEHVVIKEKIDTFLSRDSVWLHDSVLVNKSGDTIKIEKWHIKYRDRIEYKVCIDSFIKTDSVSVPYPVERKLSKWEQIKIDMGDWLIGFVIISSLILCIYFARGKVSRD